MTYLWIRAIDRNHNKFFFVQMSTDYMNGEPCARPTKDQTAMPSGISWIILDKFTDIR